MFSKKLLIPIIVAGGVVLTGLVLLAGNVWNPSWNPFKTDQIGVVEKAISKLFEAKSFSYQASASLLMNSQEVLATSTAGSVQNVSALLFIEGDLDKSQQDTIKSLSDIRITVSAGGVEFPIVGQISNIGTDIYLKIDTLPDIPFAMLDLSQAKGQWFKFNQGQEGNKEELKAIFDDFSSIFQGKNIFEIKNQVGKEKIDNETTNHYVVGFSKEGMKQVIPEMLLTMVKYGSSTMTDDQKLSVEQSLANFSDNFEQTWPDSQLSKTVFDVWVDSWRGRLKKISWQSTIQHPDKPITLDVKIAVVFSDFGKKFNIQEPTESQPFENLIEQIKTMTNLGGLTQ